MLIVVVLLRERESSLVFGEGRRGGFVFRRLFLGVVVCLGIIFFSWYFKGFFFSRSFGYG